MAILTRADKVAAERAVAAARHAETQKALDAVVAEAAETEHPIGGQVLKFGEHKPLDPLAPTPNVIRHLPIPCPCCETLLTGVLYHVFVSETKGVMVFCDGVCAACMARQTVIWDPLDVASPEAQRQAGDDITELVQNWVRELSDPLPVAATA